MCAGILPLSAMSEVPLERFPSNLYETLLKPGSNYRWSWSSQKLFEISDEALYQERMCSYWDFFERFYRGVDLPLPVDRSRGFHLFELGGRRILLVAFESIDNNDCYSDAGVLAPGTVGKCAMVLRDSGHSYDMKVAVWHHGIQGPPLRSDYMDASQIQEMAGHGFQLGLHGHQHVSTALTQYVHLDQRRKMAIVGAGSLCAGAKELPRGENRQYNLIIIEDDFLHGRIHVREMGDGEQFTRKRSGIFLDGFVDISWQAASNSIQIGSNASENNIRTAIDRAELALKESRPSEAIGFLSKIDIGTQPYAKRIKMEALLALQAWCELVGMLESARTTEPLTTEEVVILVTALIECGHIDKATAMLSTANDLDVGTQKSLRERLEIKRMIRKL